MSDYLFGVVCGAVVMGGTLGLYIVSLRRDLAEMRRDLDRNRVRGWKIGDPMP